VPVVPYRLPELIEAVANGYFVVVVEGEAKVNLLLRSWNVPATCCAGGSKSWQHEHAQFLAGADVVILPDNDPAGRSYLEDVANSLQDVAASIRVLELPDLPPKGDIVDWHRAGGTVERLHELIESEAKPWTPSTKDEDHEARAPEFSDEALALRFADRHADDLRYVAFWSQWLFWKRWRWTEDDTLAAFDHARAICREVAAATRRSKLATMLASAKTVAAVERLSKADRRLAASAAQWDDNDRIFNSPEDTT
jgi:putative DNA primase/helicase